MQRLLRFVLSVVRDPSSGIRPVLIRVDVFSVARVDPWPSVARFARRNIRRGLRTRVSILRLSQNSKVVIELRVGKQSAVRLLE